MDLLSPVPESVYFTVPMAYLRQKFPDFVTYEPSTNIYVNEAKPYKLNWLILWSLSYVLTERFRSTQLCIVRKNYFALKTGDEAAKFQTWRDGLRAGIEFIAAHAKMSIEVRPVFAGTSAAMAQPAGIKVVADFDKLFGEGVGAQVKAIYEEVVKFAAEDGFEFPPTDGQKLPEVKPLPPEPVVKPKPKPVPAPKDPNAPVAGWKKPLMWIVGILSPAVLFFLGFVVPGPIMEIVKAVVAVLKQLLGVN